MKDIGVGEEVKNRKRERERNKRWRGIESGGRANGDMGKKGRKERNRWARKDGKVFRLHFSSALYEQSGDRV